MKVILSRKGFDSTFGGCPSPIMPDGTLLSLPIPSGDSVKYKELEYDGMSYYKILQQLAPNKSYTNCHLDPDIRKTARKSMVKGWKPAFGQAGAAQGVLANAEVEPGDLFLFFGWFRRVELHNGEYRFVRRNTGGFYDHSDLQIIYGYMQVGDILTQYKDIKKYKWHPHASCNREEDCTNALYIPTDKLSLLPEKDGYGVLDYRQDRVLTMKDKTRATWDEYPFLMPEHVYGQRKNSARDEGLYYSGIWQELVVFESEGLLEWAKSIIK